MIMYLYGKNSIYERLKAKPRSIKKIFIQNNFNVPHISELIKETSIPLKVCTEKELLKIKKADRLQGILAEVEDFIYTDFEELLYRRDAGLSFIFLDNINDPHNLGSIIRIAACMGGFSVVLPRHRSCEVTDAVMHVASGGESYVPVSVVTNIPRALMDAKKEGYWTAGTVVRDGDKLNGIKLPFPLCLVMGSEGTGIRHGIEKHLDLRLTLPMEGASLSLNVAMACAIFCHEIAKQRPEIKNV